MIRCLGLLLSDSGLGEPSDVLPCILQFSVTVNPAVSVYASSERVTIRRSGPTSRYLVNLRQK